MKESDAQEFGAWLSNYDWSEVLSTENVNNKCNLFYHTPYQAIDKHFPQQFVHQHQQDKA